MRNPDKLYVFFDNHLFLKLLKLFQGKKKSLYISQRTHYTYNITLDFRQKKFSNQS